MKQPTVIQTPGRHGPRNPMKPVTISVVSHNQMHLVADLLMDLDLHCRSTVERIVLTCNLPGEQVPPLVPGGIPVVTIHNEQIAGFGANHNRAFAHCETEWFLVINPDVRMSSDVISRLLARQRPGTGLLAPQETDANGVARDHPRSVITPWSLLARRLFGRRERIVHRLAWVKGMFMLMPARAFRAVAGFDERYILYCEDFDLCARLMLRGWTVDHHPDIALHHLWQRDSKRSPIHLLHHLASLLRMWSSEAFWQYRRLLRQTALGESR